MAMKSSYTTPWDTIDWCLSMSKKQQTGANYTVRPKWGLLEAIFFHLFRY